MKSIKFLSTLLLFILLSSNTFAYSDEFTIMLETMDIPKQNILGKDINEEIYNEYKLLVYGNPLEPFSGQRWKNVTDGHWTKNSGAWKGSGIRGEYWILGTNYNGNEVHNHKFPVDIEPPTDPTKWRYAVISDALDSWQATDKYVDDMQREYILSQNLMRNNVSYDIKVMDIGLDKIRIENYPTWKTKGTLYTERYDMNNKKWAANFMVESMAGDADLEGYAKFPNGTEFELNEENGILQIPIIYGADVLNLTDYAKKEHIKEIKSQLYINGNYIEEIKDIESMSIEKNTFLNIDKNEYIPNTLIKLNVQIKSTLLTKFITDGVLTDVKEYTIFIQYGNVQSEIELGEFNIVRNEEYSEYPDIPPPQITSFEIVRIKNGKEYNLLESLKTGKKFICAGETICIKVKATNFAERFTVEFEGDKSINAFDELTKLFEWTEPKNRKEKTLYNSLKDYEKMYSDKRIIYPENDEGKYISFNYKYVIPYKTKQTLHSWSSLREVSNNAFEIDEKKMFTRISEPYQIVVKASGTTGVTTERIELDVFQRWDTLYNRDLSKYIKNIDS